MVLECSVEFSAGGGLGDIDEYFFCFLFEPVVDGFEVLVSGVLCKFVILNDDFEF